MEGFRSIPNYGERKLNAQFNLDYVEVNKAFDCFKFILVLHRCLCKRKI